VDLLALSTLGKQEMPVADALALKVICSALTHTKSPAVVCTARHWLDRPTSGAPSQAGGALVSHWIRAYDSYLK
jgi:hypothetical protein